VIAGILLAIPFAIYFAIPAYNRVDPALYGLPFFYWFQLLMLAVSTVLYTLAALILRGR